MSLVLHNKHVYLLNTSHPMINSLALRPCETFFLVLIQFNLILDCDAYLQL